MQFFGSKKRNFIKMFASLSCIIRAVPFSLIF